VTGTGIKTSRLCRAVRWRVRFGAVLALFLAGLASTACTVRTADVDRPDVLPRGAYEKVYPYHAAICAVSRIRANFAAAGGVPGHAVMYLQGVCKDESAPYPRLKLCPPEVAAAGGPQAGLGVSVNKTFKNVNWMAVPDRRLFFNGNLAPGERLDKARVLQTLEEAYEAGIWDGIEVHDTYRPAEGDRDAAVYLLASESIGTDVALLFGRHVFCATLPMPRERLARVVDFLNDLNDEYATGEAEYNWSGYADNCSHTLRNALAAAEVWRETPVRINKLRQFFNLSIPSNEMINLAKRANGYKLEDFDALFADAQLRNALLEHGWLPTRHGALVLYKAIHRPNEIYNTQAQILIHEVPLLRPLSRNIDAMYRDINFTEIEENLRFYKRRYEAILGQRPDDWESAAESGAKYAVARKRYYEAIAEQLEDVEAKLAQLEESS